MLDVCSRLLAREPDLVVTQAASAEEALPLLQAQRIDVLITDKNLPQMSGIELIAEARRLQPALEAMMITGYASSESVIAAFAAGASDYILKPFDDLRVLRAKVRAALERRAERIKGREQARGRGEAGLRAPGGGAGRSGACPPGAGRRAAQLRADGEERRDDGARGRGGQPRGRGGAERRGLPGRGAAGDARRSWSTATSSSWRRASPRWRMLAEILQSRAPDVLLLANPQADLADLLEAIGLRLDLVGFGSSSGTQALPERVKHAAGAPEHPAGADTAGQRPAALPPQHRPALSGGRSRARKSEAPALHGESGRLR